MAIGDKVVYNGEIFIVADNRGKGLNLWGGKNGITQFSDVPRSKIKELKFEDQNKGKREIEKILKKMKKGIY